MRTSLHPKDPICPNSKKLKAEMLGYLRYKRTKIAFTEFQESFSPSSDCEDIVCFNKDLDEVWCVEVKISKQDFLNDFKSKKKWKNLENQFFNKMFFAIPEELESFVLKYLQSYPQVRLFVYARQGIRVSKQAMLLKPKKTIEKKLLKKFLLRMGSEIAIMSKGYECD